MIFIPLTGVIFILTYFGANQHVEASEKCNVPGAWPQYSESEKECPKPGAKHIHQPYTVWGVAERAWLTVPPEIQVRNSTIPGAGYGTYATTSIPSGTWLGEYEGEYFSPAEGEVTTAYSWILHRGGTVTHYIDGARMETSNWLRWVNCPRTPDEENVRGVNCFGKMLYVTTKPIRRGEELMVYYGDGYAQNLGIDWRLFNAGAGDGGQCGCGCSCCG